MRNVGRSWIPCLALAFSTMGVGCATGADELIGDADIGSLSQEDAGQSKADATPIVIVTGAMDSGLPTITINSDGGRASLNPTVDGGSTGPSDDATTSTGDDSSTFPPEEDASTTPSGDSGFSFGSDSGFHHHHDAGSGTGTGSGGGTIPTTCSEADGATGCCIGNTRYYCSGGEVGTDDCTEVGKVCGWSVGSANYGCVEGPAESDPGGAPLSCGGSSGSGSGTGDAPTTCAETNGEVGCCQNDKNYFCDGTATVQSLSCPSGTTCGWGTDDGQSFYGCVTGGSGQSDPGGKYAIGCQ